MGSCCMKQRSRDKEVALLADQTWFNESEVRRLYELFRRLSSSLVDDGFISKEEFQLGLLRDRSKINLFTDRMFDLFDSKHDKLIDFGEFVRALSIFHPDTPQGEKASCRIDHLILQNLFPRTFAKGTNAWNSNVTVAFQLYDLHQTGYIEPEGVREMIVCLLNESDTLLSDDIVQAIVEKAFQEVDSKGDGRIDLEEWMVFIARTPSVLKNMTIPYLKDITTTFPSFGPKSDTEYI